MVEAGGNGIYSCVEEGEEILCLDFPEINIRVFVVHDLANYCSNGVDVNTREENEERERMQ